MPSSTRKIPKSGSHVDRIYNQLRQLAIDYKFRPGEPLNEVDLAASLGVSRTPLREVLNRLVAEGLLDFVPRRGFACPPLDTKRIFDLYEVRCGLEMMSTRLATARATDDELSQLVEQWDNSAQNFAALAPLDCVTCDQGFHEQIATLSRNAELLHLLRNVNARVHFLRLVSMEQEFFRQTTCAEHQRILVAMRQRNAEKAAQEMYTHVTLRQEQLVDVIKEAVTRLYLL